MTMNPLTIIDALLTEWASPKTRRLVHGLLGLALVVVSAWLAADQDWKVAATTLVLALYTEANRRNTPPQDGEDDEDDFAGADDIVFTDEELDAPH